MTYLKRMNIMLIGLVGAAIGVAAVAPSDAPWQPSGNAVQGQDAASRAADEPQNASVSMTMMQDPAVPIAQSCFKSTVKRTCCSSYCSARKGAERARANDIFESCTDSLSCEKDAYKAKELCDCKIDAWPG